MALGAILERFGAQVGAKLGRKSEKWRFQDDVKKCVVKNRAQVYVGVCKCMRAGGGAPYNQSNTLWTTPWTLEHSPRAQGLVADMRANTHTYVP